MQVLISETIYILGYLNWFIGFSNSSMIIFTVFHAKDKIHLGFSCNNNCPVTLLISDTLIEYKHSYLLDLMVKHMRTAPK